MSLLGLIIPSAMLISGCGQKSDLFLPDPVSQAVIEATEDESEDEADDEC